MSRVLSAIRLRDEQDEHSVRRAQFAIFAILGSSVEIIFSVVNLIRGEYLLVAVVMLSASLLIWGLCSVYKNNDPKPVFRLNTFIAFLTALALAAAGGVHGSKALWLYMAPLVAFFLFDTKEGTIWAGGLYIVVLGMMAASPSMLMPHDYPADFIYRFAATYFCVSVIARWYESERQRHHDLMAAANATLRKSEERFRSLFEASRDALFTLDPVARKLTSANSEAVAMFRAEDVPDLLSRPLESLFPYEQPDHSRSKEKAFEIIREVILEGSRFFKWTCKRLDGEEFLTDVLVTRMESDGKKFLHVTLRDITERERMERYLTQSEKMSAIGQLAAGMAHEINNPLGVILGFSQGLTSRIIREVSPQALPLRSILRETIRCKKLVDSLLVFSRQSARAMEKLALDPVVETALSMLLAQMRIKHIELVQELNSKSSVMGIKDQLQQIIINLCGNAIDAMPGGGTLTVTTARAGQKIILRVKDTGIGMPGNILKNLFEPFFTTKEVGKGTGLGLSLVYQLTQKHGGAVEVESEPGKGAVFTVTLPAV